MKKFYSLFLFLGLMTLAFTASAQESEDTETTITFFEGTLAVDLSGTGEDATILEDQKMSIDTSAEDACTVTLYDFTFAEMEIGDIVVPDVTVVTEENQLVMSGSVEGLKILGGIFKADVTCEGAYNIENETLLMDFIVVVLGMEIPVRFEGVKVDAGVQSAINDQESLPIHYYRINGLEANPNDLTPGLYIRTQGNKSRKVLVP